MYHSTDRGSFLNLASCVEGGLIAVSLILAWGLDISLKNSLHWDRFGVYYGVAGVLPMLGLFFLMNRFPIGGLSKIRRFLIDTLGPPLNACTWYDLFLLAAIAGIGEEFLFRGVVQPWMSRLGDGNLGQIIGIVGCNILFGMAHAVTWTYAIIAGLVGCYLSFLLDISEERNLLIPIIAHAVYDFIAFLVIKLTYRKEKIKNRPA